MADGAGCAVVVVVADGPLVAAAVAAEAVAVVAAEEDGDEQSDSSRLRGAALCSGLAAAALAQPRNSPQLRGFPTAEAAAMR